MIDWRPIETAPKDGTTVLLWVVPRIDGLSARGALGTWVLGEWRNSYDIDAESTHWSPINPPEDA